MRLNDTALYMFAKVKNKLLAKVQGKTAKLVSFYTHIIFQADHSLLNISPACTLQGLQPG